MAEQIPFIGREDELARLDELIRKWGTLQVVCISGPGGIGKTRLLQEVHQRAASFESLILPAKVTEKITIGFVQEFSASEWGEQFVLGIRKMTGELGIDLIETDANFDLDKMAADLDEVIQQAPDAIIVYHGSNEKLRPGLERAIERGIKVLTFDNGLERVDGLTTRVSQDENEGVRLSVDKLAEDIDFKGKIGVVWRRELSPLYKRKELLDSALGQYPDIELVAEYGTSADNITEDIYQQTKDIIRNQPDIQAIWAPWDEFARGVVRALMEANRIDVSVYSFDLNPTGINLIAQANSPWKATAATNPQEVGRIMVRLATQAVYGLGIKRRYAIPMRLITQDMLQDLIANGQDLWSDSLEIGWTPWLRSLAARDQSSLQSNLFVTEIFDFDDRTLHSSQSFGFKVAQSLDEVIFEPYLDALREWREIQHTNPSQELLARQKRILRQTFVDCFNETSAQQRVVMLWDTTDPLNKTEVLDELIQLIPELKNVLLLIAGRNADAIGKLLKDRIGEAIQIMELPPLEADASELYLKQKQDSLHISLEPELAQKILLLSQGRPILIDLATEWISRSIPLQWLTEYSLKKLKEIEENDADKVMNGLQQDFEANLVRHISKIRRPMDRLTLTMSRIYPLDAEMIAKLLRISEAEAENLFATALNYVFVKHLPDGRISLHDEMRRMVLEHVWPEVDEDGDRQRRDSKLAVEYYGAKIYSLTARIQQLKDAGQVGQTGIAEVEELQTFLTRETLERELWGLKEQLLIHTLVVDVDEGMRSFVTVFDEATSNYRFSLRPKLIAHAKHYRKRLSSEQRYKLDSRAAKCSSDEGEYSSARESATQALAGETKSPEQKIDMLILRGNAEIRLGNVDKSIIDFKEAVELSQSNDLPKWLVKAKNGLGWAYRLTGKLELATDYYRQAKNLCQHTGIFDDDYGWILNNLTFALAYQNYRNAIDFGRASVEYWHTRENKVGLGAAFLVLGTTYHRNGRFHQAESAFQNAIQIFEPLQLREWLAQAYSDLGSTHLRLDELDMAEVELRNALAIGPPNLKAMTLNRLGRLHMAKEEMAEAEKCLRGSYDRINETIDFGYSFGALAKLIVIAAKTEQYDRLDEFKQALADFEDRVRTYDQHDLGDAYFGLAALALRQKEIGTTIDFLTEGITLVTGSDGNGRANVLSKLTDLEQYFGEVGPDVVQQIGNKLKDIFIKKEADDVGYGAVTTVMICKWANWQEREN